MYKRKKTFNHLNPPSKRKNIATATIFNNNESEVEDFFEENETRRSETGSTAGKYKEEFRCHFEGDVKFGVCTICEERNIFTKIKMLGGNTKGIINHLKKVHVETYSEKFAKTEEREKEALQRRLPDFIKVAVSNFSKFMSFQNK